MIIKQKSVKRLSWSPLFWSVPLFFLGFLLLLSRKDNDQVESLIESRDRDLLVFNNNLEYTNGEYFVADSFLFEGAQQQSSTHAYSGKYSVGLHKDAIYGLSAWYAPPLKDATYHLSVHRYNPDGLKSFLVISAPDSRELYVSVGDGVYESPASDWETINAVFQVPPGVDSVKMYCYLASEEAGTVYFDDFRLSIVDLGSTGKHLRLPQIDFTVNDDGLGKLREKRKQAWDSGLLVAADDDWVKAKVHVDGIEHKAKVRLKGDWLDHLKGNSWSFRVKLTNYTSIWGMIELNIQKPDTRGFLREWIYHQILVEHDILSPRYRFCNVRLNSEPLGVYACEEHFQKELIESQSKREGPIFKFSEERMWKGVQRQFADLGKNEYSLQNDKEQSFWSAPSEAFSASDYIPGSDSYNYFQRGLVLMNHFKYGTAPLHKIFDPVLLGKYLAIVEVCGAYHSLTWHNQRWYYNPLTDKLEPIGFDGYTTDPPKLNDGFTLMAEEAYRNPQDDYEPYKRLFEDTSIATQYIFYLDSLSKKSYFQEFFAVHKSQMDTMVSAMLNEYKQNVFSATEYYDRASRIRLSIPAYQEGIECYRLAKDQIYVINHHLLPIELLPNGHQPHTYEDRLIIFPSRFRYQGNSISGILNFRNQDSLNFKVLGLDQILKSPINASTIAVDFDTRQTYVQHPLLKEDGAGYSLSSGTSDVPIIVPKGRSLLIPEGVQVDLIKRAYIAAEGRLSIAGTEDRPVVIRSSDGTGAIAVRHAKGLSEINYTIFDHLGRLDHDGSLLTGGVTFYDSEVALNYCLFKNNTGEDALNIVRSDFQVNACRFVKTAHDAADFDFCEGSIKDCVFEEIGNDAIDFSGSNARITNCRLSDIGDKGVSVGEQSTVHIYFIEIQNANIGVASKDLSHLKIDQINLTRVNTGFTAYQKKAAFGPATIDVDRFEAIKVDRIHLIESGSVFQLGRQPNATD